MKTSLPSTRAIIADVPEIKQFFCKFVYNFFEPDERSNDSGITAPEFVKKLSSESFDSAFIQSNKFNRFTSRYNKLEWKPIMEQKKIVPVTLKISDNIKKIYSEQDFAVESFVPIYLQNSGMANKLNYAIKKLIEYQRNLPADNAQVQESPLDVTKVAMERLSKQISNSLIKEGLINLEKEGYTFFNGKEKVEQESLLEDLKNVKHNMQMNTRFADLIVSTGSESAFNIFEEDETSILGEIKKLQESSNVAKNPNILDSKDYDFEILEYLDVRPIDVGGFEPRWQILGYIIDKFEILADGSSRKLEPIIIDNPNINTTVDYKIKYGATYRYSIRSVAYLETQAEDVENNEMLIISYLISSKDSAYEIVSCTEKTPPPPPADLNLRWDYYNNQLVVGWSFPINPQRDIKQWQVFRRNNIHEPFELQKVYNFDDSVIKENDDSSEMPNPDFVEILKSPKNNYIDKEFTKNSKFIYALCSVDAHGYSSNYSIQMECSFDKYNNKLVKKLISPSGSPKAYPNMNLLSDAFVDTIRDSFHSKLHIYFNPEYLKVTNSQNNDLNLLKTDKNNVYVLNIINTDLQEQTSIDIKLLDKRTTLDKKASQTNEILPTPKRFRIDKNKIIKTR